MNNRVSKYIDTDAVGSLVVQIAHNLGGTVYPFIYTIDGSGHKVVVPLYDPVIAEIKHLDENITQITFTAAFQGYVDLVYINVSLSSVSARLQDLEEKIIELTEIQSAMVNSSQWKQMNTYIFSQIDKANSDLKDLTIAMELLKADVESI